MAADSLCQALNLATTGLDKEANCILQRLGCRYRLAPEALQSCRQTACDLEGAPVQIFADLLPGNEDRCQLSQRISISQDDALK